MQLYQFEKIYSQMEKEFGKMKKGDEEIYSMLVFCKCFLAKVAKYFWRMLHLQIGESCKALTGSCPASRIAIADQI